ncbi:hypothetical protein PO909_032546 [Leuciscus waleckii]
MMIIIKSLLRSFVVLTWETFLSFASSKVPKSLAQGDQSHEVPKPLAQEGLSQEAPSSVLEEDPIQMVQTPAVPEPASEDAVPEPISAAQEGAPKSVPEHVSAAQEGSPESVPEPVSATQEGAPKLVPEPVSATQEGAPKLVPEPVSAAQVGAPESSLVFVSAALEGTLKSSLLSVPEVRENVSMSVSEPVLTSPEPVPQIITLPANAVMSPEFIPKSFLNQEIVPESASDTKTIFKTPPVKQAHVSRRATNNIPSLPVIWPLWVPEAGTSLVSIKLFPWIIFLPPSPASSVFPGCPGTPSFVLHLLSQLLPPLTSLLSVDASS